VLTRQGSEKEEPQGPNNRPEALSRDYMRLMAPKLGLVSAEAFAGRGFGYDQVGGLVTTGVLLDGELHLVALVQRTRTARANAGVVTEDVLAAIITGDEAVAFAVTEPLNGACDSRLFHSCSTLLS